MKAHRAINSKVEGDFLIAKVAVPASAGGVIAAGSEIENKLADEFRHLLDQPHPIAMIVDLEDVAHCSSGFLGLLLDVRKTLLRNGGQICLCGLNVSLREKVRSLNLEGQVFIVADDETDAIAKRHIWQR